MTTRNAAGRCEHGGRRARPAAFFELAREMCAYAERRYPGTLFSLDLDQQELCEGCGWPLMPDESPGQSP